MRVMVKEKIDHLRTGEEYDVVTPYSPHETHGSGYIAEHSKNSTLLIMPNGAGNGHTDAANIRSWWVPVSCLEVIELDNSMSKLRVGQRWRWKYNTDNWVAEIVRLVPENNYAVCKVIQVISGVKGVGEKRVNEQFEWNFDSTYWEYLVGQDRPMA